MRILLATLSALGLMSSAALADCAVHAKVMDAKAVDPTTTAASAVAEDERLVAAKKKPPEEQSMATQ